MLYFNFLFFSLFSFFTMFVVCVCVSVFAALRCEIKSIYYVCFVCLVYNSFCISKRWLIETTRPIVNKNNTFECIQIQLCMCLVSQQGRINKCGGPVRKNVWGPPPPYTVESRIESNNARPIIFGGFYVFNFIIKYRIDKDLDNKLDF